MAKAYIIIINHAGATFMEGGEISPFFAGINLTIILCIPINIVSIVTDYIYQYTEQRSVTSPIP